MKMDLNVHIKFSKNYQETCRIGSKWTYEEERSLMSKALSGVPITIIAQMHKRTIGGVKWRIMSNALTMMSYKRLSMDQVSRIVNISITELKYHKQHQEEKARSGLKWDYYEDEILMSEIQYKSLDEIALIHQRSKRAIEFRLEKLGLQFTGNSMELS